LYPAKSAIGTIYFEADAIKFPITDGTNPPRRLFVRLRLRRLPPILGRTPIPSDTKKLRPASADIGAFPVK